MSSTPTRAEPKVPTQGSDSTPDKPECVNNESSPPPGPSRFLSTGPSTSPNNGNDQNTKRKCPCKEGEEEESCQTKRSKTDNPPKKRKSKSKRDMALWKKVWLRKTDGSRLSFSDEDESGSEANERLIDEQDKQERPAECNTLSDAQERHTQGFPSAPTCSDAPFGSTPGPSRFLSCPGLSVAPNRGTKRRSPCSEQEDDEHSSSKKKSKPDDAPKKRTSELKHDLALWKEVWLKKTEQETQADFIPGGAEALHKKYTWAGMLQEGGFGQVFAGLRIEDNLPVALKFICKKKVKYTYVEVDGVPVTLPREVYFLIRAGAGPTSSDSRVTPQLLDWYELDQKIVLVLERPVPCMDLMDYLDEMGSVSNNMAKVIFRQLVDQAMELESKGIFHRDIKLDNVLLEMSSNVPRARFIDFGCATFFTPGQEFHNPQGTLHYSSPEWFCERSYTAGPTTVWQMGTVLFVLLFKRFPLDQGESIDSMTSVTIPQCIPQGCRDLLSGCLNMDPEERLTLRSLKDQPWLNSE